MTMGSTKTSASIQRPLPEGWRWVPFSDLFHAQQGVAMSPERRQGNSPRPFLRTLNVLWGRVDLSTLDKMDCTRDEVSKLRLEPGDLLICEGGDVGRTAVWRGEIDLCLHQNHVHRLRPLYENVVPEFYMYWMDVAIRAFRLYQGEESRTTIPNLSIGRLMAFPVPFTSVSEQQRIVSILSEQMEAVERAQAAGEARLEAAKALPAAYLRAVFSSPEAQQWPGIKLADLCDVKGGKRLPAGTDFAHSTTPFPYIRVVDFQDGTVRLDGLKYLEEETHAQIARYIIRSGDVYISIAGSIGVAGVIPDTLDGANLTENAARLIIRQQLVLDRDFLASFLQSPLGQDMVKERTNTVGQPKLALERIETIEVGVPSLTEQQHLVATLSGQFGEVQRLRKAVEEELDAISKLSAALLRRAFGGEL